jgi:hypothetical protein
MGNGGRKERREEEKNGRRKTGRIYKGRRKEGKKADMEQRDLINYYYNTGSRIRCFDVKPSLSISVHFQQ